MKLENYRNELKLYRVSLKGLYKTLAQISNAKISISTRTYLTPKVDNFLNTQDIQNYYFFVNNFLMLI